MRDRHWFARLMLLFMMTAIACNLFDRGGDVPDLETEEPNVDPTIPQPDVQERVIPSPRPGDGIEMSKWELWFTASPRLRGANIYQRLVYPELDGPEYMGPGPIGPPYIQSDFDELAALGANYVNISHPGLYSEDPPYQPNPDAEANLDKLLTMIGNADLFAVISFRTGPGRSEFTFFDYPSDWFDESYLNDLVWESAEAQNAWVEMWRHTAERYQDNPAVVGYDLMVEPNAEFVCCGLYDETDTFYPAMAGSSYDWNLFYPRMVAGIRVADLETPILVGSLGLSGVVWLPFLVPTDDPHTIYTIHQYAPAEYTHQEPGLFGGLSYHYPGEFDLDYDGEKEAFDRSWLEALLRPVDTFMAKFGVPVASNEFGLIRYELGAAEFMDDQMALFEARGMNYAVWEWAPSWPPLRQEQQDFAFRLGTNEDNYTEDTASDLQDVIVSYWQRNELRPSMVNFVPHR